MLDSQMDADLRLEAALNLHRSWTEKRRQAEEVRARMVLALHDAHVAGYTYQELADYLMVSRQRVGQYLEGHAV
jgi:hypothetical protein